MATSSSPLRHEQLIDRRVTKIVLGEGAVTVTRLDLDDQGRAHYNADRTDVCTVIEVYPVKTLPPAEAFGR